ncbi:MULTISPECIES: helix-turn-helix transcriptional regulator [unclassified Streptomyces]|uniref:ArsR/SmtB family transcription factor n=1 Tax=unclassified Streptomyces TaxID=2593676 RepID=UPI00225AC4F8|nr:helix-turn-helix domain-containing protein [Streptomyces sp. NBC_00047]MCX5609515.1 helix-turn-helix domain-containing protein [Streptomyces sp. NBC_00047]
MTERDAARALAHPEAAGIRLEGVLHALSDPVRLSIVRDLAGSASELACSYFDLPVTKSTTTHHFRVLRESGVVRQTYRGTTKLNALRREELEELFPGLLDSVLTAAAAEEARLDRVLGRA